MFHCGGGQHAKSPAVKLFHSPSHSGSVCLFHQEQMKITELLIPEYKVMVGEGHRYSLNYFSS